MLSDRRRRWTSNGDYSGSAPWLNFLAQLLGSASWLNSRLSYPVTKSVKSANRTKRGPHTQCVCVCVCVCTVYRV